VFFKDSEVDSDDIAFFAPEVKTWRKKIEISGSVRGTITNLSSKDMIVRAGKNTLLNGELKIAGLPDINRTFIDFKANDFRTSYADAVSFIPMLKKINDPRIDRLKYLNYKGYFTGFVHDFVAYGTVQTNLGTLVTDVNMTLLPGGASKYAGKIATTSLISAASWTTANWEKLPLTATSGETALTSRPCKPTSMATSAALSSTTTGIAI
jgi:hypothetical protein